MNLESSFFRERSDFFFFLAELLGTNLVAAEKASEDWKSDLLESCRALLARVQRKHYSLAIGLFENIGSVHAEIDAVNSL